MDSGERGMNPVAMTIINPRKQYWLRRGPNQRLPVRNRQSYESWSSCITCNGKLESVMTWDKILLKES